MKNLVLLVAAVAMIGLFVQAANRTVAPAAETIQLKYQAIQCQLDSLSLFEFNGFTFDKIKTVVRKDKWFVFDLPKTSEPRFYYVGASANNVAPVIVGTESEVVLRGGCNQFRSAVVVTSDLGKGYTDLKTRMQLISQKTGQLARDYNAKGNTAARREQIAEQFADMDIEKLDVLESTKEIDPYLGKIAALNTYLSYQNNGVKYDSEALYFAEEYFSEVDWKDEDYNYMTWVYESMKKYTETLGLFRHPDATHKTYLENVLKGIPTDARTYQLALAGIVTNLKSKQHPNFGHFATLFVEKYGETAPSAAKTLEGDLKKAQSFIIGSEAPDFAMNTPEEKSLKLSDFKGKVLLVDFWASWCGPCRRENPNVVRMYNKYKDQGFEILGVSLDKDKNRWLGAIQKDQLTWPQVSDLRGWGNAAAQQYGVSSIPHTILLDTEGRILARGLRSHELEEKLVELFGS